MDYIEHAGSLVPQLTGLNMTVWQKEPEPLKAFEEKYCFLPRIQTLYSVKGLLAFFDIKDGSHIYVLTDALETKAVVFKAEERWIILGPYVSSKWQDTAARIRLAENDAQDSVFLPYKTYRNGLPLVDTEYVVRTAALILANTVGNAPPRELEMINVAAEEFAEKADDVAKIYEEIELINKRYAVEEKLGDAICQGKTAQALQLWREMDTLCASLRFISEEMQDRIAGALGMRMLTRHAALRAGMTPVAIDALSQMYAQKMHRTIDREELDKLCEEYIAAFCAAIRATSKNSYSLYIKRAVQYIEVHLSQPIEVETLCKLNNISRKHFVHLFGKETGKTVSQYVTQARCERAAELLENSLLQINEIGRYVGYEDQSYFARVFKEFMGMTPHQYRRMKKIY